MKSFFLKLLFVIILSNTQNVFSQVPFKWTDNSDYRISKIKKYSSNSFEIPDILNDTTVQLDSEVHFTYSSDKLVKKETIMYTPQGTIITMDSILYITGDSVRIIHHYGEGKKWEYPKKLIHYNQLIKKVSDGKIDEITMNECKYKFRVKKGRIVEVKRIQTNNWYKDKYSYKNNKPDKIERQRKDMTIKSIDSFIYQIPDGYEISSSGGGLWCCSFHYFFNSDGYLIKSGIESDTNASVTIYEYGKGNGNAELFEIFGFENLLNGKPIIY